MSDRTAISWCDSTFNPWIGCTKVSPACDHCYAERLMDSRLGRVKWGHDQLRVRTSAAAWKQPIKWNARRFMQCEDCGWRGEASTPMIGCGACGSIELSDTRRRVFCASLADVFDNEVNPSWRDELVGLIVDTPHLDWLLLTKRIGNVDKMLKAEAWRHLPNVWLGATVCNQEEADRDIPKLLAVPARVRFLSIEPMLGPVDLTSVPARDTCASECCGNWRLDALKGASYCGDTERDPHDEVDEAESRVDWVICGGESGPQARPMHPDWVRSLRDQCFDAGVPFHFKQWGEWLCCETEASTDFNGRAVYVDEGFGVTLPERGLRVIQVNGAEFVHVGTKAAGRVIDGLEHNGFPAA